MSDPFTSRVRRIGAELCADLHPDFARGQKDGDALDAIGFGTDGQVLFPQSIRADGYFAGSVSSISLAEVFNVILAGIRSGRLVVTSGPIRKVVTFSDGQITFAFSTEPYERLGSALVRLALIEKSVLDEALSQVRQGQKLGQLLTNSGRLTSAQLYSALTFLVREITLDLFALPEGHFVFLEGVPPPEDEVRLPERTRDIVLDGMRRGEEAAKLRARLTAGHLVRRTSASAPPWLDDLLRRAMGTMALGDLRKSFEGGDYAFLSAVEEALKLGALQLVGQVGPPPAKTPPQGAPPLVLYRALVKAVCAALVSAKLPLDPLRTFLKSPQPGTEEAFEGVKLGPSGDLDVDRVAKNLAKLGPVLGRARAYEALNKFVYFALFSAKNTLPPERGHALELQMRALQRGEKAAK